MKQHIAVRIDEQTLAQLESIRKDISTTWRDATISDTLRAVIYAGIKVIEGAHAEELKKEAARSEGSRRRVSRST